MRYSEIPRARYNGVMFALAELLHIGSLSVFFFFTVDLILQKLRYFAAFPYRISMLLAQTSYRQATKVSLLNARRYLDGAANISERHFVRKRR